MGATRTNLALSRIVFYPVLTLKPPASVSAHPSHSRNGPGIGDAALTRLYRAEVDKPLPATGRGH
jgi:hypothetical protein